MIEHLTVDDVLLVHSDQIERYGGALGLRDRGLLESAVAQPQACFGGQALHGDLVEMAAAYLFHIVQNHPFVDGNKRTGAVAALLFLDLNGMTTQADPGVVYDLTMAIAQGQLDQVAIAARLRDVTIKP